MGLALDRLEADVREISVAGLTPATAYGALRGSGAGALVENAATGRTRARTFVALDPLETIVLDDDAGSLEKIRSAFERYRAALTAPPSGYGFICTFAYDAALSLQQIPAPVRTNRLFGDVSVFVPGTWLSFDRTTGRTTLAGIFQPAKRSAVAKRLDGYVRRLSSCRRLARASDNGNAAVRSQVIEASLSRRAFLAAVARAQRAILDGEAYQLVLGVRFSTEYSGDALELYERFIAQNPSPCSFLIERPGRALVGASPEFLARLDGARAELRPLAGTRPRGRTHQRDARLAVELLRDAKERAEHVMLVDLGRNDLAKVCRVGSVRVEKALAIERYSHVMHIASQVSGRLGAGHDAFDLFAATFPAGTVTGAPKRRAMELIASLEPTARDVYAGSVARFGFDGSLDAALTLRSIALADGRAWWQAGAGIVAASHPESEYAEILAKAQIARAVLGVERADVA